MLRCQVGVKSRRCADGRDRDDGIIRIEVFNIQHDDLITSREEFTRIIRRYRIKGAGGTSFEPVFTYARELMDAGEGTDLQGIIYFTDGYGKFPSEDPGIPTVFVLYDTDISDDELPVWARTVRID